MRLDAAGREELTFPESGMCFGCSPANPAGLKLRFFRDGGRVQCETVLDTAHQGAPEVAHGGIQAVLLDETSCATVFFTTGDHVVTGALAIRYRKPCPVGQLLRTRAEIVRDEGRFLVVHSEIRDGEDGVLTTAEGKFYRHERRGAA